MNKLRKPLEGSYFIAVFTLFGLIVGLIISIYHTVCTRSFDAFMMRPLVGGICGLCASSVHILLLWILKGLSRGRYHRPPAAQVLFFTLLLFLSFLTADRIFFPGSAENPVHSYWVYALTILSSVISSFIFVYCGISERISISLQVLGRYHLQVIQSLITVLEARDPSKRGHSKRVADGCILLARRLGLPEKTCEKLGRAALMHDLGLIFIDESLVMKESALTPEELTQIRLHPFIVKKILTPFNVLSWETEIIKTSQLFIYSVDLQKQGEKRMPAKTYFEYSLPGKKPDDLPLEARILSVVDFYDTLTHPRPYRQALSHENTIRQMYSECGTRFDRKVVSALEDMLKRKEWPLEEDRLEEVTGFEEEQIMKEIEETARNLGLLTASYRFLGTGNSAGQRAFVLTMAGSIFTGALTGLTLYATTSASQWLTIFLCQGVLAGALIFAVGFPLDRFLRRTRGSTLLGGPAGTFLSYALGAVAASLAMLHYFIYPATGTACIIDLFGALFTAVTALIAGTISLFFRLLQTASFELLKDQKRLRSLFFDLVCALSYALEAVDPYTKGHSEKVSIYARRLGEHLKLAPEKLEKLEKAALLHDIGKMAIDRTIINKPAKLTAEEYAIIKTHSAIGARTLEPFEHLRDLSVLVKAHHESFDGKGYPDRRKYDEIPLFSRIISIADTYDAMISDRAYRKGLPHEAAIAELRRCAGRQFDPDLVEPFIRTFDDMDL
ncbi:MAG: HD domain-containing protein [Candidatus Eremiobacteraeota bacterium]|nr:HD domain-containing protein [Candidatus Eremiobacteraeota bacterium]